MKLRGSSLYLRGVSLVFVLLAAVLIVFQLVQYSVSRSNYPADMTIGGVPVGGLDLRLLRKGSCRSMLLRSKSITGMPLLTWSRA